MTTTDTCATCGQPITITTRHPNKRYCSPRCRVADWHRQHDRTHLTTTPHGRVPDAVPDTHHDDVPDRVPAAPATTADTAPAAWSVTNGDPRCPHCHTPIAIIAALVPTTAAHVRTPEVITSQ
jgi:endogenous inhibitor of DNA gyrase (YacG/DUF329 family)